VRVILRHAVAIFASGLSSAQAPSFLSDHVSLAMVRRSERPSTIAFRAPVVRTVGIIHIGPLAMSLAV
jgi:hypothetical protein